MRIVFTDKELENLCLYGDTNDRRYTKYLRNKRFMSALAMKIQVVQTAQTYDDLRKYSPMKYERLKHNNGELTSFRVLNDHVERVICKECTDHIKLQIIELNADHYGNKH